MPPDSGSSDQPVVPFRMPPPMPGRPNEGAYDALLDRLALDITEELEARLPAALQEEDDVLPLVVAFIGLGAARLLPRDLSPDAPTETPTHPDGALASPSGEIAREVRDEDLLWLARLFQRGPDVGDEWGAQRELDRQQSFAFGILPFVIARLGATVPDAVLAWLDPSVATSLDGPVAMRLRSRDLMTIARTASLNAFRRVTQGQKIPRSEDQLFAAARKERKRALEPTADDAVGDTLVAGLTTAYAEWIARETPPLGIAMLVATRVIITTTALRGAPADLCWFHAPVLVPCLHYLRAFVAQSDWHACGRAGLASWHPDAVRYWTEGLAALVPRLSDALREARQKEHTGARPSTALGDAERVDHTAPAAGESLKRWQERLRSQVQAQTRELQAREGEQARLLAQLRAEHARVLAASEAENALLRQRVLQAEQAMANANDALRRVERDAQRAMQRVVQLEQTLDEERAHASVDAPPASCEGGESVLREQGDPSLDEPGADPGLPIDCFAGRRVLVFTGRDRLGVHADIAERFRRLGADEVQVRLCHRDHGPAVFDPQDCVVIDLTFAGHSDTGLIRMKASRVGAWVFAAKHGASRLADVAGRAWMERAGVEGREGAE